ncbi:MAG: transferrin-binding protein-like solute binding protein [Pseudomonadota bacterium]
MVHFSTKSAICLLAAASLSGCSVFGGGGGGGPAAPVIGGGSGGGSGGGGPSNAVPNTTQATVIARKYSLNIGLGGTTNIVGDRTASGGNQATVGERDLGGDRWGEITVDQANSTFEGGDAYSGVMATHDGSIETSDTLNETVHTYNTTAVINATLGIADYDFARSGIGFRFEPTNQEGQISAFYGSNDDTRTDAGPTASATYNGEFGAQTITPDDLGSVSGDLTMQVNIGSTATISGTIDNLEIIDQMGNEANPGVDRILLNQTTITGTTYSGTVSLVDDSGNTLGDFTNPVQPGVDARAEYNGAFFGGAGEETAGAVDMTGELEGERLDVIGVFVGRR